MATTAQFTTTPKIGLLRITAFDPARDGLVAAAGNLVFTPGANGARIDRVELIDSGPEAGATQARMARLWVYDGATARLLAEVAMPVVTPSTTVTGTKKTVAFTNGLTLPTGWTLRATLNGAAAVTAADALNIIAHGGDY